MTVERVGLRRGRRGGPARTRRDRTPRDRRPAHVVRPRVAGRGRPTGSDATPTGSSASTATRSTASWSVREVVREPVDQVVLVGTYGARPPPPAPNPPEPAGTPLRRAAAATTSGTGWRVRVRRELGSARDLPRWAAVPPVDLVGAQAVRRPDLRLRGDPRPADRRGPQVQRVAGLGAPGRTARASSVCADRPVSVRAGRRRRRRGVPIRLASVRPTREDRPAHPDRGAAAAARARARAAQGRGSELRRRSEHRAPHRGGGRPRPDDTVLEVGPGLGSLTLGLRRGRCAASSRSRSTPGWSAPLGEVLADRAERRGGPRRRAAQPTSGRSSTAGRPGWSRTCPTTPRPRS